MSPENEFRPPLETSNTDEPEYRYYKLDLYSPYEDSTQSLEYKNKRPEKPWGFRAKVENKTVIVRDKKTVIQVLSNFEVFNPHRPKPELTKTESIPNSSKPIKIYHIGGMQSLGAHHIADTLLRWYNAQNDLEGFDISNLTILSHPWGSPTEMEDISIADCGDALSQCIPQTEDDSDVVITGLSTGATIATSLGTKLSQELRPPQALVLMDPVGLTPNPNLIQNFIKDAWGALKDNLRKNDKFPIAVKETWKQLMASMAISTGAPDNIYLLIKSLVHLDPDAQKILEDNPNLSKPVGLDINKLQSDLTTELRNDIDPKTKIIILSILNSDVSSVFDDLNKYVEQHPEVMSQYPKLAKQIASAAQKLLFEKNETAFIGITASSHMVIGSDQHPMDSIAQTLQQILHPQK